MSTEPEPADEPGLDTPIAAEPVYLLVGFGSLLVQLLLLALRELSVVGLIASVIGAAGLLFRWRASPFLLMLFLAVAFLFSPRDPGFFKQQADLLQGAALLGYLLAQFRLFGLEEQTVPVTAERRQPRGDKAPEKSQRPVTTGELLRGAFTVGGALVGAMALWVMLPNDPILLRERLRLVPGVEVVIGEQPPRYWAAFDFGEGWWQLFLLVWLFGLLILATRTVLGYIGWLRMPAETARLVLQDEAWVQTRREQQRLQAWRQKGVRKA